MKLQIQISPEDLLKPIRPVGETYEDIRRLENLNERIEFIQTLLTDIEEVADGKNRVEYSIKKAALVADEFLNSLTARDN
jgi:hypothetical protein